MELKMTSKDIRIEYVNEQEDEVVQNISYDIVEGEQVVGSANVHPYGYNLNINANEGSIDANRDKLESILLGLEVTNE